jgi:hypothetical protein
MKKIATMFTSAALLAAAVIPAIAAGNSCGSATTGPLSNNYCTINNTSSVTVNNVNDAQISNHVRAVSNTGNNSASFNTLGGAITTGNATLNATISNVANINTTTITGGPAAGSNTGLNEITGPSSFNQAAINNSNRVDVYNSNTATVKNRVDAETNTGDNVADFNTGPASVRTGNAALNVGVGTHVNDSATEVAAGAGGAGPNTVGNSTTGPLSQNFATLNNASDVVVNNVSDLIVGNFVDALANTGRNRASTNTLGGDIATGNAGTGVGVETIGNINTTTVEVAMGGFANDASNGVTGPLSNNYSGVDNNQNIVVDNWNNKCQSHNADRLESIFHHRRSNVDEEGCDVEDLGVWNFDYDVANTGDNVSDFNTGGGAVDTGWTSLWKDISTRLNDTLTVIKP